MTIHIKDLIGNKNINAQIMVTHGAAQLNNCAMGHQLYSGIAGGGKTTTAKAVAALTGAPFFEVTAETVKTAEDIACLFHKFPDDGYSPTGDKIGKINPPIVFIDEIHQLSLKSEELLGIAMESFRHTYNEGRGKHKRSVTSWVPEFTLIGATTKEGELSKPFRDRFKQIMIFGHYSLEESCEIVKLHARKKGIEITEEAVNDIAQRGRGTPRLLVRYLDASNDLRVYHGRGEITGEITRTQFKLQKIDDAGLTAIDIAILKELYRSSGPCGLDSLAVKTNLDVRTVKNVNEPYLIRMGLIERGGRGRTITDQGIEHLAKFGHIEEPAQELGSSRVLSSKKI